MKPLEVELKRLEDLAEDVVNDFAYMRQREQEMRDTNGNFNKFRFLVGMTNCECTGFTALKVTLSISFMVAMSFKFVILKCSGCH